MISLNTLGQENLTKEQFKKPEKVATQDLPEKAPGIATAIVSDGKVIFEKYAGYANLADSTMISPGSRFHEGATGAWKATVLRLLTKNISFITLTNTGKSIPFTQTRQMVDVVFDVTVRDDYKTTGLLISRAKMLVDFYTLEFEQNDMISQPYLSGDRIKKVSFKKK